jgi:hypothetical protein
VRNIRLGQFCYLSRLLRIEWQRSNTARREPVKAAHVARSVDAVKLNGGRGDRHVLNLEIVCALTL